MYQRKKVALIGISGRVGKSLAQRIEASSLWNLVMGLKRDLSDLDNLKSSNTLPHIIIDFSHAETTHQLAKMMIDSPIPLLIGTTGLKAQTYDLLQTCAKTAPVMIAPNTSIGIILMHKLLRLTVQQFNHTFDIDIVETHHRHKKDAPSGTALSLQKTLNNATTNSINIHSLRAGKDTADHVVSFQGDNESLTFSHRVSSRDVFADGALRLASWLIQQKPGFYTTDDFLNTSSIK